MSIYSEEKIHHFYDEVLGNYVRIESKYIRNPEAGSNWNPPAVHKASDGPDVFPEGDKFYRYNGGKKYYLDPQ